MFAAMRPAVKAVLGQMFSKPQNAGDYLQLAGRFGPELIFPLINAGMLPEGSSMGEHWRSTLVDPWVASFLEGSAGGDWHDRAAGQWAASGHGRQSTLG